MKALQKPTAKSMPVRMGALNLLTLIIALCLAVLAVLSLSTADASARLSARQANQLTQVYAVEQAGQEFLAALDTELAIAAGQGKDKYQMARAAESMRFDPTGGQNIAVYIQSSANTVDATFTTPENQSLTVRLALTDNGQFSILEWKSVKLWTNNTDREQLFRSQKA